MVPVRLRPAWRGKPLNGIARRAWHGFGMTTSQATGVVVAKKQSPGFLLGPKPVPERIRLH
jgi:hypothetical protein